MFFRVRELEYGNMRLYAHVTRHIRLGQKCMGALEGGIVLKLVQTPPKSKRTNLREKGVTEGDSMVLTAKLQQSITSNFKASIFDLLTKLFWLPLSNTQRVSAEAGGPNHSHLISL